MMETEMELGDLLITSLLRVSASSQARGFNTSIYSRELSLSLRTLLKLKIALYTDFAWRTAYSLVHLLNWMYKAMHLII